MVEALVTVSGLIGEAGVVMGFVGPAGFWAAAGAVVVIVVVPI
ncbi:MAG: hypothetical protein AAGB97_03535 [Dehalococcoidia bacterium]|nr:hypothetical protein [Chloroflexota bacterium]